ncbi:fumarate hydratase [Tepidiforma flava]|uniref:Fumarate hydratase n=1 Tax=Tepidiforma flava TaxID=3004094 RepID=A0ABY7M636_9CHLR|nr:MULTISPECIES: fumarate hydratase [Tepidiforma]MCX7617473.1 fumarate hydratase [Tepidiforma sp.]WBL36006.1 fumarate hydratase [Tepidiforma flava]GIW17529.1 MAG: fumarate hydratase [Tepidiforma sp.]
MREVPAELITETVARLAIEATHFLPEDVEGAIRAARQTERSPLAVQIIDEILENAQVARERMLPLCQDTGTAVVILEIGQDVHITGGYVIDAVNEGIRRGYSEGYLRKSIAARPFSARVNTGDNTPGVIHTEIVPGDRIKVMFMPKGGGCENMSRYQNFLPGMGKQAVIDFVCETVDMSGGNPCPPLVIGVGVGGTAEKAMTMAKHALFRKIGERSPDPEVAELEQELLQAVNELGVGPQAVGGSTTALDVFVETYPTHITALPVAVNIQCHSARTKQAVI